MEITKEQHAVLKDLLAQIWTEPVPKSEFMAAQVQTIVSSDTEKIMNSPSQGKRKLILQNPHSPGDIIMMATAIRDLHATYPGEYQTDVDCPCPEIYEGNPYITKLDPHAPDVAVMRAHYPLIQESNQGCHHFIHAYRMHLQELIGRPIKQGYFKGDIHIRDEEKGWISAVEEITKDQRPFWLIDAGYKPDFTAKAWSFQRYQAVVDHFKNKIQFVQVGHASHFHPKLKGVINMVGQTDLRQLIRLVYHSIGVLTPVSMPMVLAASVPMKLPFPKQRACVVLSGGREPVQWQCWPDQQFIHTCGTMDCCDYGGCWKSRVVPLGDGDEKDKNNLCVHPVKVGDQWLGQCMANISVRDVTRAIERYYEANGVFKYGNWKTVETAYKNRDAVKVNTYNDLALDKVGSETSMTSSETSSTMENPHACPACDKTE